MNISIQNGIIYTIAYFLGSIPFSVVIGKVFFHTDVRKHGSGNPGATNTLRTLGTTAGLVVLLLDMAKGAAAVILAFYLTLGEQLNVQERMTVAGALAIAGHVFSPFLSFKGGKGVATTVGVIIALHPPIAAIVSATFLLVLYLSRYVSLSSILASFMFTILMLLWHPGSAVEIIFAVSVTLLIVIKHKANIIRLLKGEESRFQLRKTAS